MKDDKYKLANYFIVITMILGTILMAVFRYMPVKLAAYFCIVPIIIAPFFLNKTKLKLTARDRMIYYLFIFFAYFIGGILNLYNTTTYYDVFMHFLSGILTSYLAIYILKRIDKYKKKDIIFIIFFIIIFSLAIANLWEICEFTIDRVIGSNLQHYKDTGVVDTMEDLICALCGSIVFITIYLLNNKKSKRK